MKKFFIIACVLGLVNYSTEDCSASNRRKKNASNVCQLENDFNLRELERHYSYCQGQAWHWPQTLSSIDEKVSEMLVADIKKPSNRDKIAIWAFLENGFSLQHFIGSQYYNREKHSPMIINLLKLSAKLVKTLNSIEKDQNIYVCEYNKIIDELNSNDVDVALVCSYNFNEIRSCIASIFYENIRWPCE